MPKMFGSSSDDFDRLEKLGPMKTVHPHPARTFTRDEAGYLHVRHVSRSLGRAMNGPRTGPERIMRLHERLAQAKNIYFQWPASDGSKTPQKGHERRARESRAHSRSKKPWRREQQRVEQGKSRIHPHFDLGIDPSIAMGFDRFVEIENGEILGREASFGRICRGEEELRHATWDFLDDPHLYGDYPNPLDDWYVEDGLRDDLWYGHHRADCSCKSCKYDRHEDRYEDPDGYRARDDIFEGYGDYDAECQAAHDLENDDSPFDDRP